MGSLERASSPSTALASSVLKVTGSTLYGCGELNDIRNPLLPSKVFFMLIQLQEHLETLFSQSKKTVQASIDNYRKAQNTIFHKARTISQTSKALRTESDTPVISLRPTFLCLQCPTVYTPREEENHRQSKGHMFGP